MESPLLGFHSRPPHDVIAGLDPAIQRGCEIARFHAVALDRRVEPGDDSLGVDVMCPSTLRAQAVSSGASVPLWSDPL
jgi:hypothetical protein